MEPKQGLQPCGRGVGNGEQPMRATLRILVAAVAALAFLRIAPAITQAQSISTPELTAAAGENAIDLSWNEIENAARYQLWAWNEADGWQLLDDALTVTSYRHEGLEEGATWFYTIRAFDAALGQYGSWADYASATVGELLRAPELTADATATGAIELSWTAVAGASVYHLWAWNRADGWQLLDKALTVTRFTHVAHADGRIWYYTVRAIGAGDIRGPWAEYATATAATPTTTATPTPTTGPAGRVDGPQEQTATPTPTATATSTPTETVSDESRKSVGAIVSFHGFNRFSVTLYWGLPTEEPVNYQVNWAEAGQSYSEGSVAYTTATQYRITGLKEEVAYNVRVRARYSGNHGPWSTLTLAPFFGHPQ